MIDTFVLADGKEMNDQVTSPAQKHLRDVNPNSKPLNNEKSEIFHSIVATLFWMMKRPRPDLETAIGFLCTRVSKAMRMIGKKSGELSLLLKEP